MDARKFGVPAKKKLKPWMHFVLNKNKMVKHGSTLICCTCWKETHLEVDFSNSKDNSYFCLCKVTDWILKDEVETNIVY